MPYQDDPEEERRRRLLLSLEGMDTTVVMAPDDEDETEETEAAVKPDNAKLSPAQLNYQKVVSQQPTAAAYQPSRGRRALAAIAGGLTAFGNPALGMQTAQDII